MRTIAVSSNTSWSIYNFRRGLLRALLRRGDRVWVLAPTDEYSQRLADLGCNLIAVAIDNRGTNPARDAVLIWRYFQIYRKLRPTVSLHFTVKPVIYGSLAAALLRVPSINTVTGLGAAFSQNNWLLQIVKHLYRVSQHRAKTIFFQNREDMSIFQAGGLVPPEKVQHVPGSGVDTQWFQVQPFPTQKETTFLMMSRILREKGVLEYVEVARRMRSEGSQARFCLLGPLDTSCPSAIGRDEISSWTNEGSIEYLGQADDVRPFVAEAHCVVLPSFYREGVPKVLLEAAAMGRPAITTDSAGCRDAVKHGETGFLCEAKSVESLYGAARRFLAMPKQEQMDMGVAARTRVVRMFDEQDVIQRYLEEIDGCR